ncbi:MAG: hypothetical protein JRI23_16315 [Deltaproteobacteria bacterium]|jgi:uncharacterized membrane protein|nr:hypothetical protein [Deltaproteobacteria bacterium]MBW2533336.1 hypothetical protein [Deltaproteobacteria bacterium]
MSSAAKRWPAAVIVVASLLGLAFSAVSSFDYINHLDRQVHDIACSYVPGVTVGEGADEGCRAAMYSPWGAVLRDQYWGGIPIALFAVGAFGFFAAFGTYLLLAGRTAPRKSGLFIALCGATPLVASVVMAVIAATRLGQFCKTCIGMYAASTLLAIGAIAYLLDLRGERRSPKGKAKGGVAPTVVDEEAGGRPSAPLRPEGALWMPLGWLVALGCFAAAPALIYANSTPSYSKYITQCGTLEAAPKTPKDFVQMAPRTASVKATLVVDPLCASCKSLHQRLEVDGYLAKLDATLVMFPLDSECNWMLEQAVHPGACELSKAVLCGEHRASQVLDWIYANQDNLLEGAKAAAGINNVHAAIRRRFPELIECVKSKETAQRLDRVMRFAVDNRLPVSTPQLFVGGTRLCDEDTDIGLAYSLPRLAPELKPL